MSALWIPAVISLSLVIVHFIWGGRDVARPLLATRELPRDVVYLLYLCWHAVTIILTAFVVAYVAAALDPDFRAYAIYATAIAGAIGIWALALAIWKRQPHRAMPQWVAFLVLAATGAWALA